MTTIRQLTCTKCGKKYVYYPSYSGTKPKGWAKSTRTHCPECVEKEESLAWKKIDDSKVRHRWAHPETGEPECSGDKEAFVSPDFYADAGTPVCGECGADMEYAGTEIKILLAEREITETDLVIIAEFAAGLIEGLSIDPVVDSLDLSDGEVARISGVIGDFLGRKTPDPRVCILCGKKASIDEFCEACAKSITNTAAEAMDLYKVAIDAGPHDGFEERVILEALAFKIVRQAKERIKP
jgi:hypothetical protein